MITVRVQSDDFDAGAEIALATQGNAGAVASFTGVVRGGGGTASITLDHYPGMTERALSDLAEQAMGRWSLGAITLIHRVGTLAAGAQIVLVVTASEHRAAALESCAFLIDRLKTDAPFWKKENGTDGRSQWVEAKKTDDTAAARWD
jgi:molybdopterin synthase catalytic subunit